MTGSKEMPSSLAPAVAAGGSPRSAERPSPFRALLWKEWRQQRWVFALAAVLPPGVLFAVRSASDGDLGLILGVITLGLTALVLGANAFVGEEDDRSAEFQRALPVKRGRLFWVKAGVCLALLALSVLLLAATAGVFRGWLWPGGVIRGWVREIAAGEVLVALLLLIPALLAVTMVPAMLAGAARRTLHGVLLSLVFVAVVVLSVALPLAASRWSGGLFGNDGRGLALLACAAGAQAVVTARLLWGRRAARTTPRRRAAHVSGVIGLFLALGWVPVLVFFLYVTLAAPLQYFFGHRSGYTPEIHPPPVGGRWCAVNVYYPLYLNRVAFVDAQTGRTVWASRWASSEYAPLATGAALWSPSGKRVLLRGEGEWRPWRRRGVGERSDARVSRKGPGWFVFEPDTGRRIPLNVPELGNLRPPFLLPCGWADEDTVALKGPEDVEFLNVETGRRRHCVLPSALRGKGFLTWEVSQAGGDFWALFVPRRAAQETPLRFLRFSPDLGEAELVVSSSAALAPHLRLISPDAGWAVVADGGGKGGRVLLVPVRAGGPGQVLGEGAEGRGIYPFQCVFRTNPFRLAGCVGSQCIVINLQDMSRRAFDLTAESVGERVGLQRAEFAPGGRYAVLLMVRNTRGTWAHFWRVADVDTGRRWDTGFDMFAGYPLWLDEERLVVQRWSRAPLVIRYDGAERRPLIGD